jgi:hypothetical protein
VTLIIPASIIVHIRLLFIGSHHLLFLLIIVWFYLVLDLCIMYGSVYTYDVQQWYTCACFYKSLCNILLSDFSLAFAWNLVDLGSLHENGIFYPALLLENLKFYPKGK